MKVEFNVRDAGTTGKSTVEVWCHITYGAATFFGEAIVIRHPETTAEVALEQAHQEALQLALTKLNDGGPSYETAVRTVRERMVAYRDLASEDFLFHSEERSEKPKSDGLRMAEQHTAIALMELYLDLSKTSK